MNEESNRTILAVIPARGGSKGIPRKNLAPLAGKYLIQHTFEAALASQELDMVILSTDDPEIGEIGRQSGVDVPFLRPAELATDTASTESVAEHAVTWLEESRGVQFDAVMVLQPTSPLRQAWHIDGAVNEFRAKSADAMISVCDVSEHPYDLVSFADGLMEYSTPRPTSPTRRQDYPQYYFINGAIYLVRAVVLKQQHTLLPKNALPFIMERRYSFDIDTAEDLLIAESLLDILHESPIYP